MVRGSLLGGGNFSRWGWMTKFSAGGRGLPTNRDNPACWSIAVKK